MASVVADLEDVEEINAEGPARNGRSAVAGFATIHELANVAIAEVYGGRCSPRKANAALVREIDSMEAIRCVAQKKSNVDVLNSKRQIGGGEDR